jgi:hypothetical protein
MRLKFPLNVELQCHGFLPARPSGSMLFPAIDGHCIYLRKYEVHILSICQVYNKLETPRPCPLLLFTARSSFLIDFSKHRR